MKILMTGATGLVGKELGKALVFAGHELVVLTRDPRNAQALLSFPATLLEWKHYTHKIPPRYFEGVDTVIHLAGENIAAGRWSKARKTQIHESRAIGTRNLVEAIKAEGKSVKRLISASAIGIYGDTSDWVSEDATRGNGFLADVCASWEREATALSESGVKVAIPRIGIVLSRQGGALEKMLMPFSLGLGGVIGSGKQWMSWIHHEDLTRLFMHLVEHPELVGPFNAVAPAPVTNRDFSKLLAHSLGRSLFFPVPSLALRIGLGEMSTLITGGQRVACKNIRAAGFSFKYSELSDALGELCAPLLNGQKELLAEIWLPKKREEIFPFFSDEKNLETLTPDHLNFKVLKKSTAEINEGTLIDYRLKVHGVPMHWRTLIENWEPGRKFVDRQLKGPYALWHHTHEFTDFAGGTLMRDRVLYRLPLGRLGDAIAGWFVKKDVGGIFSYRQQTIRRIFN
jgi:hypothetical protein